MQGVMVPMGDLQKTRVLIVDDIPEVLEVINEWLVQRGFETLQATSGEEALALAAHYLPDLILLDVMMPQMDGIETCRRLKDNPQTAEIPVILITAKEPSDARADGLLTGATDYITKPIDFDNMNTRIRKALKITQTDSGDVAQRLLAEVTHTTMTMTDSALVWVLATDKQAGLLISKTLTTTSGSLEEEQFLSRIRHHNPTPQFSLADLSNPLCEVLETRQAHLNLPVHQLEKSPSTQGLYTALAPLQVQYLTIMPLSALGNTLGVMVIGDYQPLDLTSPRSEQIRYAFSNQAAIALDYTRLMDDLQQREREQQAEQTFRQMILDTMSDALAVIDEHGIIKYVNRRMLRMGNFPAGYLEGQSVGTLFHPDDRAEVMHGLLQEIAATMKFDQRLLTHDQKVIPVLLSRSRVQSDQRDNQVIVLSDMTEQKERQTALETQAAALEEQAIALERQTNRLLALNRAAQAIAANLSLRETLHHILFAAIDVSGARGASLFLVNKDNPNELMILAAVGYKAEELLGLRVAVGQGLAGWVAQEAKSVLVDDVRNDSRFYDGVDQQTGIKSSSLIAVPLKHTEKVIGVIEVVNKQDDEAFDLDDVRMLESMAGTAAVSITNARLFDDAKRRVTELGTLLSASEAASSTLDFPNVLDHITGTLLTGLDVDHCIILSWGDQAEHLESLAESINTYFPDMDQSPRRIITEPSLAASTLQTGHIVKTSLREPSISPADKEHLLRLGMVTMISAPVIIGDTFSGVLSLYSANKKQRYTNDQLQQVMETIHIWAQSYGRPSNLYDNHLDTLNALIESVRRVTPITWTTLEAYDPNTHSLFTLREMGFVDWTRRKGKKLFIDQYPAMQLALKGRNVNMIYQDDDIPHTPQQQWITEKGAKAAMLIPLITHGDAIGLVILLYMEQINFEQDEFRLAQGIANVVSNAVENARLFQSLQTRAKALENAYQELREADHVKDQFIQNVSHELRTPLIHILGYAGLLADGAFGDVNPDQQEALVTISEKGQLVADIVEDMVAVQAQEMPPLEMEAVDMTKLLEQALTENQTAIQESGLKILTHYSHNIPKVAANPQKLIEAFTKLLENALKFGADGKQVEIMLRDTGGAFVQVAIRDYGIGIAPEEHTKIFQRFYQVDGGAARRYGGTGLGLAVAKAIIEAHSGKIGLKSQLNEGTIFHFTIPKYNLAFRNPESQ
jgi:PAS domain S-box-containing protein